MRSCTTTTAGLWFRLDESRGSRHAHLDSLAAPLATLHARASNPNHQVLTHLHSWAELETNPVWTWWGLTSPLHLAPFQSAIVLAAGFDRSLTFELGQALAPEIPWRPHMPVLAQDRPYAARTLTIRYFAEEHVATRYRFDSAPGKAALTQIAGHLARERPSIWSCNEADRSIFLPRLQRGFVLPRQAGTNNYADLDSTALIYTAKPDPRETRVLSALGIEPMAVVESREYDVLYQFIARTSLRDPQSNRPVTAWVYDRVQAEAVAQSFACQPAVDVGLQLVNLGFADVAPARRSLSGLSPEEKAARVREKARLRKRRQRARKA